MNIVAQNLRRPTRSLPNAALPKSAADALFRPPAPPKVDAPHAGPPAQADPPRGVPGTKSSPGAGAEARRRAFVKLANARMVKALDDISLLGNLSNKKNYRYTDRDVQAMEAALLQAIDKAMAHFKSPRDEVPGFALPEDEEAA